MPDSRVTQNRRVLARRWAAVGTAAAVSVLSITGALGIGPGAALGEPSRRVADMQPPQPDSSAGTDGADPVASASDGWLTFEKPDRQTEVLPDVPPAEDPSAFASTALPARTGHGKRVVYSEGAQRVWLVGATDKVVRTYLVSGGKDEDLLKPGRYRVYSKSRHAISYDYKQTMNYMVRFTTGDNAAIGFHDLPARHNGTLAQTRSDLGTPLSSGCIRQWVVDAKALWTFSSVGTLVVVTD